LFEPLVTLPVSVAASCDVWTFTNGVEDMKRFWDVRGTGFEPMLVATLAARSEADFDKLYQELIDFAEYNGFTDEAVAECVQYMKDNYPDDWATYQKGY
jgi:hypothetical protein